MSLDLDILQEEKYMSPTLRQILKMRDRQFGEDDSFFVRLFPYEDRIAMLNNYEASKYARGYVPDVHYKLLNSKIVKKIHKKLIAKITSNVDIEGEKDADITEVKELISAFSNKIKKGVSYMLSRGEACLTVSHNEGEKVLIEAYPLARYDLKKNVFGEIQEAMLYKQLFDGPHKYLKYMLVEHRYKKGDNYYVEYKVMEYTFTSMNYSEDVKRYEIEYSKLPYETRQVLGDIELYKPSIIPCLGVYRIKNTETNELCPHSDIGESQYMDVLDEAVSLDTSYTYRDVDKNIGRGRMVVPSLAAATPKAIQLNRDGSASRVGYGESKTVLDTTFMQPYPNMTGDTSKATPQAVQFNLRTMEWISDKQDYVTSICTGCGLSVFDYDPTLCSGARTAREIDELSDLTASTVNEKRSILTQEINKMLKDIAMMLGKSISIFVKWDKSTTVNTAANNELVLARKSAGLMSRETAIKMLNPNWTLEEVQAELERIDGDTDNTNPDILFNNL